jgi:hypothetical protein
MLVAIGAITLAVFAQISVSKKTEALAIEKVLVSKTVSALREAQLTTEAQLAKEKKGNVIASTAQAELSKRLTKANMDKIMASTTQEALSRRVTDLSSQLRDQINLVSTLEAKNMCDNNAPSFINYYDNSTVSKSLKDWLNKTEENIYSATWDTTWSNSKTAIHKLTGEYLYVFIVYFDEPKLDHEHSTFDFQSRCWLDR